MLSLSSPLLTYWPSPITWAEEDHFISGLGAITGRGTASGTGESSAELASTVAGHPGIWKLACGTASASIASLGFPGLLSFANTDGKYAFRSIISPQSLFSAGNTGQLFWGFGNTMVAGTAPTSGFYFQYDTALSASIPYAVVAGAGTLSQASGVTLVGTSWYDSMIVVDNAALTVEFYLTLALTAAASANGQYPSYGTPVATFSMPSNQSGGLQAGITTIKGASGSTSVSTYIDYWGLFFSGGPATMEGMSLQSVN
jgi:hypothetical protein